MTMRAEEEDSVGLTDRDRRLMGLMAEHGFQARSIQELPQPDDAESHLQRLKSFLGSADERRTAYGLTIQACIALRDVYEAGLSYSEIRAETGLSTSTISLHLTDECSHDMICRRRCNAIRAARWDGISFYEISRVLDIGRGASHPHARGECPHVGGHDVAPQDRDG